MSGSVHVFCFCRSCVRSCVLTVVAPQFLRLLMGTEKPLRGEASMGDHMVVANYFAQNQAEALDPTRTVLGTLEEAAGTEMAAPDIKSLLGKMGFKGEAHDKKVDCLSGGEKARLALAKFMVTPASLLLLVRCSVAALLLGQALALTHTRGVRRTSRPTTWTSHRRRCLRRRYHTSRREPATTHLGALQFADAAPRAGHGAGGVARPLLPPQDRHARAGAEEWRHGRLLGRL